MLSPVKRIPAGRIACPLLFALAFAIGALNSWPVVATASGQLPADFDPLQAIVGRWAVDAADCVGNRYVWRFTRDRMALIIDNAPTPREYPVSWSAGENDVSATLDEGGRAATLVFRFVAPTEFVTARVAVDGAERRLGIRHTPGAPPPVRQHWRRCG
jgi:hypothetical protein